MLKVLKKLYSPLAYLIFFKNFDVFILNSPNFLKFFFKKTKKKKILVQHQTLEQYWKRSDYFGQDCNLLKRVKGEIDVVVTLSPLDKAEFIEKFELSKSKVTSIRHTSTMPLLETSKKKSKNLIMVCRLYNPHKRLDLAIKSMRYLNDFTLNIYGSGPDEKTLKKLKEDLKLSNVKFHGNTNKVQEKLDENGIYIMPSDYEGYPVSLVEALRRGLPIVLRNTFTASQDIVQGNGVLLGREWNEDEFVRGVKEAYDNYDRYSKKSIELGKRHNFNVIEKEWKKLMGKLEEE